MLYFTCSFFLETSATIYKQQESPDYWDFIFSFSPILLYRIAIGNNGHLALAAHWLILAALFLYFRDERLDWSWPVLICISVLVQPYLFAMVLVIWFAAVIRLFSKKLLIKVLLAKHILIVILLIFLVMWASGYFMFNSVGVSSGYEQFRWTLSSPIDPSLLEVLNGQESWRIFHN